MPNNPDIYIILCSTFLKLYLSHNASFSFIASISIIAYAYNGAIQCLVIFSFPSFELPKGNKISYYVGTKKLIL